MGSDASLVLAAGVGVRRGWGCGLRSVSFRLDGPLPGGTILGIAASQQSAGSAVIRLLAGLSQPAHGELRVLGEDLTTARGRAVVRSHVGVARRPSRLQPRLAIRGLVARAARRASLPGRDQEVLTAAILDRLALTQWADVPVRLAPTAVGCRAGLAAAAVHEPGLLLLDGLFDGLTPPELASLTDGVRELAVDTAVIAAGRDATALGLACDEVLTLSEGILAAA
jgi:ABC-2 type transport system ATP-binding protein